MPTGDVAIRPTTLLRLEQTSILFTRLVDLAEVAVRDGRPEGAAVLAQLAAHHAWQNPTGALVDVRLEQLLVTLGRTAVPSPGPVAARPGGRHHVLHVLTEAYETGGHSRLAWRWIERDDARVTVALTQGHSGPPASLEQAVTSKGGRVHSLASVEPTLTGRARRLRDLAADADVVVLHLHPYDVVPAMALAACPVPVVYVNHADHCFWVGLAVTDVVCDHRLAGRRVTAVKRRVADGHRAVLPLPVDGPADLPAEAPAGRSATSPEATGDDRSDPRRAATRRDLNVADGDILTVTVAHEGKTRPLHGPGLADVLEMLALAHPCFRAVVVGPRPDGPAWAAVAERTEGRVRAVGVVADPAALLAAADIYLDSTPVGSVTALLEAVAAGLPAVSLFRFPGLTDVFGSNAPGLGEDHPVETTVDGFLATVAALIRDGGRRRAQAANARDAVCAHHSGPAWAEGLADLYRRAELAGRIEPGSPPAPGGTDCGSVAADPYDALLSDYHATSGMTMDLAALVAHHRSLMGAEVAAAAVADAELSAMIGGGVTPPPAADGGGDLRPPTIVFPPAWPDQPQWLSETFARMASASSPDRVPLRAVLPLPGPVSPAVVEAAMTAAAAALADAGLDPAELPFDVVVGDDDSVQDPDYPWRRLVLSGCSVPEVAWLRSLRPPRTGESVNENIRSEPEETPSCPKP